MSSFLNQQLTNVGWDALSIALGGGRLTFFKLQAGSGTITNDAAIPPMTALVAPVYDLAITSFVIEGDGQVTLFANISSEQVTTGFNFKELGVFAVIEDPVAGQGGVPSGPNISAIVGAPSTLANPVVPNPGYGTPLMYSYANSYAVADYIPGAGESTDVVNTIQVTVKIDKAPNVQISIIQGEQFAVTNIGAPSVGAGPWSYTQANVGYFKRLKPGAATIITEDANTITVGAKQLTADLDLYVANGNPDIAPDFSTINNAINYLGQYLIPTTIRARIHVQPGVYVGSSTDGATHFTLNHPNSQNITIQGPQNNPVQGTTISITGSANNWSATIGTISDTSQFKVNDWVIVDYVGGMTTNNHACLCGFFKVTAKTANSVTFLVPWRGTSFPIAGFSTATLIPISAIISCPLNTGGLVCGSYGVGLLQYLGIVAQATPTRAGGIHGAVVAGSGTLKCIGVSGFNAALNAQQTNQCDGIVSGSTNGSIFCVSCGATNNQNGFVGSGGGSISWSRCGASHNKVRGIWVDSGGACSFQQGYTNVGGNGEVGIMISGGTTLIALNTIPFGFAFSHQNASWGIGVVGRGMLAMGAGCNIHLSGNVQYDLVADTFGLVMGQSNILGTRVFNLPIGTMSGTGGLIT
jgi:hypothetical protein